MAITCLRLNADGHSALKRSETMVALHCVFSTPKDNSLSRNPEEDELKQGDYRDILSLMRVLIYGPKSKAEVDTLIERYV